MVKAVAWSQVVHYQAVVSEVHHSDLKARIVWRTASLSTLVLLNQVQDGHTGLV